MPADMTYIFIVIPLYCWDIKPVFTQNVPAFSKNRKRDMQKTMILLSCTVTFVL